MRSEGERVYRPIVATRIALGIVCLVWAGFTVAFLIGGGMFIAHTGPTAALEVIPSVALAAALSWICLRGVLLKVIASERGLKIVNFLRTQEIGWNEIAGFSSDSGYWGISVSLRSGKSVLLNAVTKSNWSTWTHRRARADAIAEELNDRVKQRTLGLRLPDAPAGASEP